MKHKLMHGSIVVAFISIAIACMIYVPFPLYVNTFCDIAYTFLEIKDKTADRSVVYCYTYMFTQ